MAKIQNKAELENFIVTNWNKVNDFLDQYSKDLPLPIYSSVDIRESSEKFAPVDNNLYPAGFNNLCALDIKASSERFHHYILSRAGEAKKVGIITESHTKNTFYLDHLQSLKQALTAGGHQVFFISLDPNLFADQKYLELSSNSLGELTINLAEIKDNQLTIMESGDEIDFAILNNDQSSPIEVDWANLKTPVHPSPELGWFRREKARHFHFYHQVLTDFCNELEIEPTLMEASFDFVTGVNFSTKDGLAEVAGKIDELQAKVGGDKKIFVKASQGTYGMGISVVESGEDILSLNRKGRNKMDVGKNRKKFTTVVLQEGIETMIKFGTSPAEVTIYLVGGEAVGGFMRANPLRSTTGNLNAKGMIYQKYCISEIRQSCEHQCKEAVYSIIARLSTIAAALETNEIIS
ncbi:MAG: hypothetical protein HOE90_06905 [Bacteriovoracaceae bacterium]|jgi:glutamate--cysteine ligase|nr:hypothetical protein [Bacteriovoracaceae bacterium]